METTIIVYWGSIWIMENKMEATIMGLLKGLSQEGTQFLRQGCPDLGCAPCGAPLVYLKLLKVSDVQVTKTTLFRAKNSLRTERRVVQGFS